MAVLKKGSKGKDVEKLQETLNKAGAKPPLKVDGIFGPITEGQVKTFQKKYKLKADGQVGDESQAAFKYGGPLPEMTVEDYVKRKEYFHKNWEQTRDQVKSYMSVQKEVDALAEVADKEVPNAVENFKTNIPLWGEVVTMCDEIIAKQKEFDGLRLSNPSKAEGLVKECETLDDKVNKFGSSKIVPNRNKAAESLKAVRTKLKSALAALESELAEIEKRSASWAPP